MNPEPSGGILKRAFRNAGLLLGGKTAAGIMQLGTFALAGRGLGLDAFGLFTVVVAQVMLITGLAAFDSNQAVIRYGVLHLNAKDRQGFQALIKAGVLLDIGAAVFAVIATVIAAPLMANWLGWGPEQVLLAQLTAPLAFANAISTPRGMLRLFDRFDLLTTHSIVTPLFRLFFFFILWASDASLGWYIAAWIVAGWIGAVVIYIMAWQETAKHHLFDGMTLSFRRLAERNQGMWRFAIMSNLNSSVALVPTQLSVLIVASLLGPAAAGVFRIAREFGMGMMKPVHLVNQALYPDMARLVAARNWQRLTKAGVRAGALAALAGAGVTLLIYLVGEQIIAFVMGIDFIAATPVLVAIGIGTSIRVLAFAAEPVMYAMGRPQTPLIISIVTTVLFVGIMYWRLPIDGLNGAGWAFIGIGIAGAVLSTLAAVFMIRQEKDADDGNAADKERLA